MMQDLRFGVRTLRKHKSFTAIAVVTLALGIGANTAIFSVVNAVLLRPLPYAQSERLVTLWGNFQKLNITRLPAKAGEYRDYREQAQSFTEVAASSSTEYSLTGDGVPERIAGASVTENLFATLDVQVGQGRGFTLADQQAGSAAVVIVSHEFWQQRYGGAADVLGKTLRLNEQPHTIIGVMPEGFQYPHASLLFGTPAAVFTPAVFSAEQIAQRSPPYNLRVVARLKPAVTLAQARAEMAVIGQSFVDANKPGYRGPKGEDGGWQVTVNPLLEEAVGQSRFALLLLLGAVALVLLIACANVANLMLARAAVRQRELAIRVALGASRWRIVRQMLTESLLLSGLGAAGGLLFAWWGVAVLTKFKLDNLPRLAESKLDGRVLAFTILVSLLTTWLCGWLPAWQAARTDVQQTIKEGGGTVMPHRSWLRNALVIGEVALAVLLLVGAGLLLNSLVRVQRVNPGLEIDKLLTVELTLPTARYSGIAPVKAFTEDLLPRIESLPGVEQASLSTQMPLSSYEGSAPFTIEGYELKGNELPNGEWRVVAPHYFRTLGQTLLQGRDFTTQDGEDAAIISATMARQYWPNANAIGKRVALGSPSPGNPFHTIIGIVSDLPQGALEAPPGRHLYLPFAARAPQRLYLLVRAAGEPATLAAALRQQVWAVDKELPIGKVLTLREFVSGTLAPRRFTTSLLGGFAALALLLGALGIYSVLSFSVAARTQEFGIRMALGAQARDVLWLILQRGLILVAMGLGIGLAASLFVTRWLKTLLFGVTTTDLLTYGGVSVLLLLIALLACYLPARRATKVDPLIALRHN